ncbi:transmembrane protein 145-like, partial [Saccoglossus kowalevskii]|uniref:Transmembrane protein 145-like n=1 Tax=Saccoglossus kowalevskii TaxID=10224 RepID=A0ABM0MPQ3_SACKO
ILTRPAAANQNFPYHVRTSQIGAIETPNGTVSEDIDAFSHSAYGANNFIGSYANTNFTELFTVSGNTMNGGTTTTTTPNGTSGDVVKKNNNEGLERQTDPNIFTTSMTTSANSDA